MQLPGLLCKEQLSRRAFLGHRGGQAGCRGTRGQQKGTPVVSVLCIFLTGESQSQSFARDARKLRRPFSLVLPAPLLSSACSVQVLSTCPALSRTGSAGTPHLAHPLNGIPALEHLPGTAWGPLCPCPPSAPQQQTLHLSLSTPLPPSFKVLLN